MFSFILGILGGIVGGVIGGPFGALKGFAIGYSLGGIADFLFAGSDTVVQKSPRLHDLKVQTSSYGVDIPKIYGVGRVSGNVFWSPLKNLSPNRSNINGSVSRKSRSGGIRRVAFARTSANWSSMA